MVIPAADITVKRYITAKEVLIRGYRGERVVKRI
jgi:hypothetical protein